MRNELKTLKDFEEHLEKRSEFKPNWKNENFIAGMSYGQLQLIKGLKQEATNWIKELEKSGDKPSIFVNRWIKHFFSISDEEISNVK